VTTALALKNLSKRAIFNNMEGLIDVPGAGLGVWGSKIVLLSLDGMIGRIKQEIKGAPHDQQAVHKRRVEDKSRSAWLWAWPAPVVFVGLVSDAVCCIRSLLSCGLWRCWQYM
jgi:hypothetical protein